MSLHPQVVTTQYGWGQGCQELDRHVGPYDQFERLGIASGVARHRLHRVERLRSRCTRHACQVPAVGLTGEPAHRGRREGPQVKRWVGLLDRL
jgi:hypothetical protein